MRTKINETTKRIIISMFILLAVALTAFNIQTCRLVETRQQLESIRVELNKSSDQQQRIGEIVRGTNEILSESFDTIEGIRSQIRVIRNSYEEMEKLLYNIDTNNSGLNNLDNCEVLNNEEVGRSN